MGGSRGSLGGSPGRLGNAFGTILARLWSTFGAFGLLKAVKLHFFIRRWADFCLGQGSWDDFGSIFSSLLNGNHAVGIGTPRGRLAASLWNSPKRGPGDDFRSVLGASGPSRDQFAMDFCTVCSIPGTIEPMPNYLPRPLCCAPRCACLSLARRSVRSTLNSSVVKRLARLRSLALPQLRDL